MSACLNYFLALYIVKTEPYVDRTAFNNEVGTMMGLSFPIISLPCMAVSVHTPYGFLIKGIRDNAGYSLRGSNQKIIAHNQIQLSEGNNSSIYYSKFYVRAQSV